MAKKVQVSEENLKLLEVLVMYANNDLEFYRKITEYIYHLGHNLSWEEEKKLRDKLHEISEILNPVFK